ncbi:MAG: 4-(cytidine 5'-diphospho)-2-C-methyl-D-erythritol kinase [Gammaproteobacteria bacterium]|nr:MAG: 4-(cytidine 5'-diphospho)-2-C-methyl-D-erythritol kinase [Gammaproteobacteria bacterium]
MPGEPSMIKSQAIRVAAPAKINRFLHVHQQRSDGFHELKTYFQLIDLCDYLTFSVNRSGVVRVDNPTIDIDEKKDLCYRAAILLQQYTTQPLGVDIVVEKHIPDGGGLGGGSSDAAAVLVVLNRLWQLNLSEETLLSIGLSLGSDVPVFIYGKSVCAEGRGGIFVPDINAHVTGKEKFLIIKPNVQVATRKIFQSQRLTKRSGTGKIRDLDTASLIQSGENDFESVVFALYPSIFQVVERLSGYVKLHLTGTGACLYTVLDDVRKADRITCTLGSDCQAFVVNAIETSPLNDFK